MIKKYFRREHFGYVLRNSVEKIAYINNIFGLLIPARFSLCIIRVVYGIDIPEDQTNGSVAVEVHLIITFI